MTRRFWVGLALSTPVIVLEMAGHLFGLSQYITPPSSNWIQHIDIKVPKRRASTRKRRSADLVEATAISPGQGRGAGAGGG
jgi:hypothetical protein